MKDKELLLVKLPKLNGIDQDFFGIGYYTDHGFVFGILREDWINIQPLRIITYKEYGNDDAENIEIIGEIKNVPNPR